MFWYCLPDSRLLHAFNPETSSRVTLALLGAVFHTDLTYSGDSLPLHRLGFLQPLFFKKVNVILSILWLDAKIYFV